MTMADSISTSYSGRIIFPLAHGDEKTSRAITIEDPITNSESIAAAVSSISSWMRNSANESMRWMIQPASWRDTDPTEKENPDGSPITSNQVTWSISAADPFKFEITQKTVQIWNEDYGGDSGNGE